MNPEDLLGAQAILAYTLSGQALDGAMDALEDPASPSHGAVLAYLASLGFAPSNAPQMGQTYSVGEAAQAFGEGSDGPNGRAGGYQFGPYALNNGAQGSGDDDPLFWMGRGTPSGGGDFAYNRAYAAEFINPNWRFQDDWEARKRGIDQGVGGGTYGGYAQGGRFSVGVNPNLSRNAPVRNNHGTIQRRVSSGQFGTGILKAGTGGRMAKRLQSTVREFLTKNYKDQRVGEGGGEQSGTLLQAVRGAQVEASSESERGFSLDVTLMDLKRTARQNEPEGVSTLYYGPRVFQGRRAVRPSAQPYLRFKMNGVWMTSRNARAAAPKNIFEFSPEQMRVIGEQFTAVLAEQLVAGLADGNGTSSRGADSSGSREE